jgi:hypothetical protein
VANNQQLNQRQNDDRPERQSDNAQSGKDPKWRKPIGEPREEAQRAKEQTERGDRNNRRAKTQERGNKQGGLTQEERQEKKFDLIRKNPFNSVVIVQNSGETRALASKAIDLDKRFSAVRENMFNRLPGEYGALALQDAQDALETLDELERRLNALRIGGGRFYESVRLNPKHIKRFHILKLISFAKQADKLSVSLKALGVEGEAISETLKNAIAAIEAEEREEKERIAREQEEVRQAKAEEKAKRRAEYEARQTQQRPQVEEAGESEANETPTIEADSADTQAKPKTKKEKAA